MAVETNTPPILGNQYSDYNYMGTQNYLTLISPDQFDPTLVRRFARNETRLIMDYLIESGAKKGTRSPIFSHQEEDRNESVILFQAASGGAANAAVTFDVATLYQPDFPSAAPAPFTTAGATAKAPIRVRDVVQFPNGVQARVTAINRDNGGETSVTLSPKVLGESIPAVLDTDEIIILGNEQNEASTSQESIAPRKIDYENYIYTHREAWEATNLGFIPSFLKNLGEGGSEMWYDEGIFNTHQRAKKQVDRMLFMSKKATNTTLNGLSGNTRTFTTEGMLPFIENNGTVQDYTINAFGLTDIEAANNTLAANQGSSENLLWASRKFKTALDNTFRTTTGFTNGGIQYSDQMAQKDVDFGFQSFSYGGFTYKVNTLTTLDDPNALGATGQATQDLAIIMPANTEGYLGGNVNTPACRIVYLEDGKSSNGYLEVMTGAFAGNSRTHNLVIDMFWQVGFEGFAANRWIKLNGVNA